MDKNDFEYGLKIVFFSQSVCDDGTWHECPFVPEGYVWRAEHSDAELPVVSMSPHGFSVSSAQTQASFVTAIYAFRLDYWLEKGQELLFSNGEMS